jgi:probable F420-dependent oxidoreductase
MEFGVGYFPTHDGIGPGALARLVEERGHDALFFAEHSHIPASRETPYPSGGPLPMKYWHSYDLFVALTAAAVATTKLRVGSGICLLVQRDPIITANEVASIDHLSGGRLEFGVGAGWNREEMRNHGTDPRTRMALLHERVEAVRAIWSQDEASYSGRYVNFERIWSYPKPAQRPGPPVLVGGDGPGVLDRVLAFGDGWLPNWRHDPALFDRVRELRARSQRPVEVQLLSAPADPKVLETMRANGVRRAMRWLPSGPRGPVERALDRWEAAVADVNGG